MHLLKLKQRSFAVFLALVPIFGFAAGLGKLNVSSSLGEPLKAEIELLSVTPEELASLSAVVAPEEAYAVQGIPRLGIHSDIKVELSKNAEGSPVIKLHTHLPVSDPYLDILIQVDWSSGRLLREYTILLDPPEYQQNIKNSHTADSLIPSPSASASGNHDVNNEKPATVDASSKQPVTSFKKDASSLTKTQDPEVTADATRLSPQIKTRQGDSLATIARTYQSDGVSLDQMLVGLFESNRHAFIAGNMNRLKVGQILKVPSREVLTSIDANEAAQEVKLQSANWNAYRNSLATAVVTAKAAELAESKQSASGKVTTAEDQAAKPKAGPQDVIKLSAGNVSDKSNDNTNTSDSKELALQEEVITREKALKEAQERTALLEAQIADMKKLLALKNQALANAQATAEQASKNTQDVKQPATQAATNTVAARNPPVAPASDAQNKAPPSKLSATAGKLVSGDSVQKPVSPADVPEENPTLEPASFINFVLETSQGAALALAAGLTLLMAVWAYVRNRRKRLLDGFERGIRSSEALSANTSSSDDEHQGSAEAEFLPRFTHTPDESMIDTDEVDPIAEAEVYMAYGRDAQAEEILKDAISKTPQRYELHLKLIEIYASRKDVSAFDAMAGELYTHLGANHPIWAKVAEMGVVLEPDNPLYDLSHLPVSDQVAENDDHLTQSLAELESLMSNQNLPATDEASGTPNGDVNAVSMESVANPQAPESNRLDDNGLDFDVSAIEALVANADNPQADHQAGSEASVNFDRASSQPEHIEFASDLAAQSTGTSEVTSEIQPAEKAETLLEKDQEVEGAHLGFEEINFTENVDQHPVLSALQDIDLNFGDAENAPVPKNNRVEEIHFDFPIPEMSDTESVEEAPLNDADTAGKAYDLSSINLDLDHDGQMGAPSEPKLALDEEATPAVRLATDMASAMHAVAESDRDSSTASVSAENPDVDIKLDLVKVYIDMDDLEGARELLQEVIKEGNDNQRARAEQVLASIK